ncbi:MAG: transposase [Opitutae bacterium]|nr:transposase [Opitutae bacterium]
MLPQRKHPAHFATHGGGNRSVIVFLTICVHRRRTLLANDVAHRLLFAAWSKDDRWRVGRYVVMPDHVHLFCSPGVWPPTSLDDWIEYWKNLATRAWPRAEQKPIWQKGHWDTQLRTGDSYAAKWEYVRNNPVRHGLVVPAEDWPFAGEVHELRWHD